MTRPMKARLVKGAAGMLLGALLSAAGAAAQVLEGEVTGIADGDTLTVLVDGRRELRVRLAWIDAPETGRGQKRPGQPFGQAAKRSLSEICYRQRARVQAIDQDRYGRTVGRVFCAGRDANLEQVRRGYAWAYRRYDPPREFLEAEREARAARRGLWADPGASPPWEWRGGVSFPPR